MFIVPLTSSMPSVEKLESIGKIDPIAQQKEDSQETFGDILRMKIQGVKDLEMQSLQSAYDIATGASSDLETAMLDSAKASTAIELTTQITTRVVNAYKEIMQMQI